MNSNPEQLVQIQMFLIMPFTENDQNVKLSWTTWPAPGATFAKNINIFT